MQSVNLESFPAESCENELFMIITCIRNSSCSYGDIHLKKENYHWIYFLLNLTWLNNEFFRMFENSGFASNPCGWGGGGGFVMLLISLENKEYF